MADLNSTMTSMPISHPLLSFLPSMAPSRSSWKHYIITIGVTYLIVCQALRFRREKAMRRRYGYPDRASLAKMTTEDAQKIVKEINQFEFPAFGNVSLQFALFKTYAIESISRLLLATRNLTDPEASLKRFEDTAVIIGEFLINPPDSDRAIEAIARMNYLHSHYVACGKISNADLLYTLSVFITEPERFFRLYDWRPLNEMEYCAFGTLWKRIGEAMGIQYEGYLSKAEWSDGLDFAQDIAKWAKSYEVVAFVPSQTSHMPAKALIPMMTYWAPGWMQGFAKECVISLLGDRTREAFMLPEPGIAANALVYNTLVLRRFVARHLCLPRYFPYQRHALQPDANGQLHLNISYGNFPFYRKPTFWNRWGPEAWLIWLAGGVLPGDRPEYYMAKGWKTEDLGPKNWMGQGVDAMEKDTLKMKREGMGGCPF